MPYASYPSETASASVSKVPLTSVSWMRTNLFSELGGLGSFYRRIGRQRVCGGRLWYTTWSLDVRAPGFHAAAVDQIARSYVGLTGAWEYRDAKIGQELPTRDSVRKGDFGEIVAGSLFSRRLGDDVPFQKLEWMRPTQNATVQGPDVLALTLSGSLSHPEPVLVEVKLRPEISPQKDLEGIRSSLGRVSPDYIVSAWRAAVRAMRGHPAHEKQFALSAAELLAQLTAEPGTYPEHEKQAVIVTTRDTLTVAKIEEHWVTSPPVSELHVITVDNLVTLMNSLFDEVGRRTYGDVASGAPHLITTRTHTPGLGAPVVSDEAAKALRLSEGPTSPMLLIEASLWLLADWDGMGTARASALAANATDPVVKGLAHLLAGRVGRRARDSLSSEPVLIAFLDAVDSAWKLRTTADDLSAATRLAAEATEDPAIALAVRYVGAAICHRLPRHPRRMTQDAKAEGPNVQHVVNEMLRYGKRAFWPSQAKAIEGGLLDRNHPSMAIKMPTSAGKTKLIELMSADALDATDDSVVVVLAPTKALVRQLSSDLHSALPDDVPVRSSHGGLDFDVEGPSSQGLMGETGVVVVTPERFDLEWRQAVASSNREVIDRVCLVVVDEAHLINEAGRGPRLELILGRALRSGIRIVLVSSQLPELANVASWLGGRAVESDWTPTWLERYVYYESEDQRSGLLRTASDDAAEVLQLTTSKKPTNGECHNSRPHQAAALAEQYLGHDLVVVYSNQRRLTGGLVKTVSERISSLPAWDDLELTPLIETIEASDPEYARLLRIGVGVHHGGVPRRVRSVVEVAARKKLLRCVVCSPTLLEGVDFPTKTVIAAYPPESYGRPEIGKLQSLAGRAGRGGLFASGVLIVMAANENKAGEWLDAFNKQLPPTKSALTRALRKMFNWAQDVLSGQENRDDELLAVVDSTLLAAIAEGAVIDGDLRRALEELLGQTYWYAGASTIEREKLLERAVQRAQFIASRVGTDQWSKTFYRSGLPLKSGLALRDALVPHAGYLYSEVFDPDGDHDELLLWLAAEVTPVTAELTHLGTVPAHDLKGALSMWLSGHLEGDISARCQEAWNAIKPEDLDTLLPWLLTASIDIVATETASLDFRELAYRRLAPERIRYGVPRTEMCELVRDGFDRDDAIAIDTEFEQAPMSVQMMGLREYGQQKKREREAALREEYEEEPPF